MGRSAEFSEKVELLRTCILNFGSGSGSNVVFCLKTK